MTGLLVAAMAAGFLLGVVATVLWVLRSTKYGQRVDQQLERREQERRLQRLTHLAVVQMLAEARRAQQTGQR